MEFDTWLSKWQNSLLLGLLLQYISVKQRYGIELIQYAQKMLDPGIKIPTVYSILKRLTDMGITIQLEADDKDQITRGTKRKYYKLTKHGEAYLQKIQEILMKSRLIINIITGDNN